MRSSGYLLACGLLTACASTPREMIKTEVAPGADLSGLRSYAWSGKPPLDNPFGRERVVDDIDAQMRARGWIEAADAEVADLSISAKVDTRMKQSTNTFYSQGATRGWGLRPYTSGRIDSPASPRMKEHVDKVGTLTVAIFNPRSHDEVWQATVVVEVSESQERTNSAVDSGIVKLFSGFPPAGRH